LPDEAARKLEVLNSLLRDRLRDGLVIAFSGGVDSAFLLWAAKGEQGRTGGRVLALTAVSESMASVEREDAARLARELGVEHRWETSHELSDPRYAANDGTRCYHCKTELFRIGGEILQQDGFRWLAYGYNASDRSDTRPGHRAALENDVLSPLAEAGLTKDDIRVLMRAHGLPLWDKPASPCLSSRLMTGVAVTPEKLQDIEAFETLLRQGGMKVVRARLHEEGATRFVRVETPSHEMSRALELRESLTREARARGYRWVVLDLEGYRTGGGV